jgi:hypothetical protein
LQSAQAQCDFAVQSPLLDVKPLTIRLNPPLKCPVNV